MDSNLKPAELTASPAAALPASLSRLAALPMKSKLALGAATLALTALLVATLSMGRDPDWKPLYAGMSDKDGGAVLAALSTMNVPYKISDAGGTFMVPADRVHEVRLKLASQGLPKGGTVGFEIMEGQKFGVTQFQERLNFQRGLEGELSRSIMALQAVQAARVHLALPAQTAFMREQQKPSASVLLTLYGGRTLDRAQIAGVVHLVASSVPDMQPAAVSVVDQNGTLLSQEPGNVPNGLNATQQQYVRQTERELQARILAIVEPIVGPGNVKAQVNADVDFTQSESTAEMYGPNQGSNPAAVRSQQLSEAPGASGPGSAGLGGGVAGALANQPPPTQNSPINGPGQTPGVAGAAAGGAAAGIKRDAMTNYEVDKTVKVTRNATGTVKRLSAAVIVNHASVKGGDGKMQLKPLTAQQIEQINSLAREAIGFSKDRGDSLNVVNAPFNVAAAEPVPELAIWQKPENIALARSLAPWIALPLVALIIIFGFVRPAIKAARPPKTATLLDASVQDPIALPVPGDENQNAEGALEPPQVPLLAGVTAAQQAQAEARTAQLEFIRQQARQNPATVANVLRNWSDGQGQPAT